MQVFKWFYDNYLLNGYLAADHPNLVPHNPCIELAEMIVELQKRAVLPMAIFAKTVATGKHAGISFTDSTPLRVCNNKRILTTRCSRTLL